MAHFARIVDGRVESVVVVSNCAIGGCIGSDHPDYQANPEAHATCGIIDFPESEPLGQAMLAESGFTGLWLQCSYNNNFRGVYPPIGCQYDPEADAFVSPTIVEPVE